MIKTLIVEEEQVIRDAFKQLIQRAPAETELTASFHSVNEAVNYLSSNEAPDLIFSDVRLPDGLSFEIFNRVPVRSPVVFVTECDNYLLNAFEHNGIDYLTKPVLEKDLVKALNRYRTLEAHFSNHHSFVSKFKKSTKSRLMVRRGIEHISLRIEDIAFIFTEDKIVYVTDNNGRKFLSDRTLSELEEELDPSTFFRANRQYIVSISYIRSYRSYDRVKLMIDMAVADLKKPVIVSQEMAGSFRKWISDL